MFFRALFGAGAEVTVRRGHLTMTPQTPVPAMRRGMRLHPDDLEDPLVFRSENPGYGMTNRVVFRPGSGDGRSGAALHGPVLALQAAGGPQPKTLGDRPRGSRSCRPCRRSPPKHARLRPRTGRAGPWLDVRSRSHRQCVAFCVGAKLTRLIHAQTGSQSQHVQYTAEAYRHCGARSPLRVARRRGLLALRTGKRRRARPGGGDHGEEPFQGIEGDPGGR